MARLPPRDVRRPPPPRWRRPLALLILGAGLALLTLVMAADIGGTPRLEALAFRLGLATAPLLQAFGIALSLTGGWMLWRRDR
ncbi:hypothetical protein [uncultured Phenylobacterium sp.]|uniref:hypothetical protein n=1 Tax=uncultured Phenylobacterium sp. TaxID=349273 RepID=UPI0025D61C33|nr:hypothetical protein [uncultured Phenylobacterium sp.]